MIEKETSVMADICGITVTTVDEGKSKEEGSMVSNNDDKKMKRSNVEEIRSNMVLKKLLRPARYFDPPIDAGLMTNCSCDSCGKQGHTTFNCPNPNKSPLRKRCFLCGSFEHIGEQCSMEHDSCPDDGSAITSICLRCGGMGHDMALCNYEYSEDDLKDVQCYVCKSFGHLCCVEPPCDSSWDVSCYKCGRLGHIGLECGRYDSSSDRKRDSVSKRWKRRYSSSELAERKKRRIEKALATSAAIRDRLEKKKQMKLEEQEHSTLHESNGKTKMNDGNSEQNSTSHESNGKKNDENLKQHSTLHESNGENNDGNSKQHSTLHESNGKTKKDNDESEHNFIKEGEEDEEEQEN